MIALVIVAIAGFSYFALSGKLSRVIGGPATTSPEENPPDAVSISTPAGNQDMVNGGIVNNSPITNDPDTWPSGDAIWDICQAIAHAEGYDVPNSVPFRLNNPGDISDGASQFGSQAHSGSNVTTFPDAATGWNWLYNKINRHVNGQSSTYPKAMTITQFAQKYAANWENWKRIVGQELQVDPDMSSFAEYVGV